MPLRHINEADRAGGATPTATASAARRVDDDVILDVVRRLVLTHGISRTTLTDVAREAGLSRMTVYRRWNGLPELLGQMMQREWDRILPFDIGALADQVSAGSNVRQILVREVVTAARILRESELLSSIIKGEPQLLQPYLVQRQGTMHRRAIARISDAIRAGQADGSITAGDPVRLATAVVMTLQSWVVSMDAAGAEQPPALLDDELRAMLHAYLRPAPATGA